MVRCARFGFEGDQLISLERGDRNSVAQEDAVRGNGGDARSRRQDAGEIQGISAADRDKLRFLPISRPISANGTQKAHSLGQARIARR